MSISIPKFAALGSALVGTGAIFSEAMGSGSSENPSPIKTKDEPVISKSFSSKAVTTIQGACRVWEVERARDSYNVIRVIREIKDKNGFVSDLDIVANKTFVDEVQDACLGKKGGHFRVGNDVYIYVYKSENKWMYSGSMQGHDWHHKTNFRSTQ
ncbi:hypothetical protein MHF_1109 [Mycoplasma haemofelis Ohio2]|uniref:Uncharacterized protein n=1 Tax=Mycoplasma haemofelis (strain Ohio2) TaxID=859194 RepID=F6FJK1_MYCHI|nr:hypothetical protein MHF_1109 [Mycoplasma haemofelis Ohio2]